MTSATDAITYVFPPPPTPSLPVSDTNDRFPIHRVYCLGRNYADHAREMGATDVGASRRPMFFSKPPDAVCASETIPFPPATADLQHEVELVAAIGRGGRDISETEALDHVFGYAVGIDLTRRDLQRAAKQRRHPWDMAKGFDYSAPCSAVHRIERVGHPESGAIVLDVNGERRQSGDLSEQIWSVARAIVALSSLVAMCAGDLLFMGTPAGVGPVVAGDLLEGRIDPVGSVRLRVETATTPS